MKDGAGKSTLMKVLYGLENRNAGEIIYRGQPVSFKKPGEAIASGIGMVHQEIFTHSRITPSGRHVVLGIEPNWILGRIDETRA